MDNTFFGIYVPAKSTAAMTMAMVLAIVLGGMIGLEREIRGRAAGLRTHMLVCVGSTLFTLVSVNLSRGDPGRIAAQVVSGIGFLGAGAIIREGMNIRGLTTAASIWTTAAIGLALGAGPRFGELAVIGTVIVVFTLWIVDRFEDWVEAKVYKLVDLVVELRDAQDSSARVLERIAAHRGFIRAMEFERQEETDVQKMTVHMKLPDRADRAKLVAEISQEPDIVSCRLA
jgi:putative Mg2+ transporter-C (MgtC) family protein